MKIKFFLLLCLFLLTIKCDGGNKDEREQQEDAYKELCETTKPSKKEDCFSVLNTTVQEDFKIYCCYLEYKLKNKPSDDDEPQEFKGCDKFDKDEYEDLDSWEESAKAELKKDNNELVSFSVYCDEKHSATGSSSSVSLKFGLISLFAALLI